MVQGGLVLVLAVVVVLAALMVMRVVVLALALPALMEAVEDITAQLGLMEQSVSFGPAQPAHSHLLVQETCK
jgi:hypothetical protein